MSCAIEAHGVMVKTRLDGGHLPGQNFQIVLAGMLQEALGQFKAAFIFDSRIILDLGG